MDSSVGRPLDARVWALAEENVAQWSQLDPCAAIVAGVAVSGVGLTDYGDEACEDRAALARRTCDLALALRGVLPSGPAAVATSVVAERCGVEADLYESGQMQRRLDILTSPLQEIRRSIELTAPSSDNADGDGGAAARGEEWEAFTARLGGVPTAVDSYLSGLRAAADRGDRPAIRQIDAVAKQCQQFAEREHFLGLAARATSAVPGQSPSAARAELADAAIAADAAYAHAAAWLREELGPRARTDDAFGADRYRLWARWYVGGDVDLHAAHEWAAEEFTRLETRAANVAADVGDEAPVREVIARLYQDPRLQVHGRDNIRDWLRCCSDRASSAVAALFEIPSELDTLDWEVTDSGGVYYHPPAEDGSRPGSVQWSLSDGEPLATWLAPPTVVHEGIPGHHLQIGRTVLLGDHLTRFQRHRCEIAGYVEGWGLYTERLMDTLGFYASSAEQLGYLQNQFLRTARVLVDIGVHLQLPIPAVLRHSPGERWTAQTAHTFLAERVGLTGSSLDFELDRYLGRGGQAIAYRLGEERWLNLLSSAAPSAGAALRQAHETALSLGPANFDQLQAALTR